MTNDPLIATALLGTARMSAMPVPPDPFLEEAWNAIPIGNPASALLQALALAGTLHRAGTRSRGVNEDLPACPEDARPLLPPAAADLAARLLAGEHAELLPEWLKLAGASGMLLPARMVPDLLAAATGNDALCRIAPAIAGERGRWLARRREEFSWLLESAAVDDSAWETGKTSERLAWLRQTRASDPAKAAGAVSSNWASEDGPTREAILRIVSEQPLPCDESWLESQALKDRRQEVRELAAVSLTGIPDSAFRTRAIARVRERVKIERRLLRRFIVVEPPDSFDPVWTLDGIKEKPPQATGEKAWWLRQILAMVPLDDWPGLLGVAPDELFQLPRDKDWQDALILAWIDSSRRMPARALAGAFVPFVATLEPWPSQAGMKHLVLQTILDAQPKELRFALLDRVSATLPEPIALELISRCGESPPEGMGSGVFAMIRRAIGTVPSPLTRPQARALALCVPPAEIQSWLETIARMPELTAPAEEFANTLEFRRSMIQHLSTP